MNQISIDVGHGACILLACFSGVGLDASNLLACSPPAHAFGVFVRLRRASFWFGDQPNRRTP
jgi:hypothetical protein